jgi:Uncharacterized alpha/beta hydrolase domain (DUF2235)
VTKRIILLLDGTWNDQDFGPADTNIVRFQQNIAKTLGVVQSVPKREPHHSGEQRQLVKGYVSKEGKENIVFYERGVGTGAFDRLRGGVFGDGLGGNVRRAYKFLSYWYEEGDQVFVFGFSRGAFTARSLIGYVGAAGLLTRDSCGRENEGLAWNFYRTSPNDRLPGIWAQLGKLVHDRENFHIDCVGVFDTVGALGIPVNWFNVANRDHFAFHSVELSSITKVNLQAIAIDEHRWPFQAAIWRKPKFKQFSTVTEQVWFPGAHADIGGSYINEVTREADHPRALDDITLDWMIKRIRTHFGDFPIDPGWKNVDGTWALADQHEPRQGIYRGETFALRSIANLPLTQLGWYQSNVCWDRHADPIGEMVHISALERLGASVDSEGRSIRYQPANLLRAIGAIRATYGKGLGVPAPENDVRVVAWCGRDLHPEDPADRAVVNELLNKQRSPK